MDESFWRRVHFLRFSPGSTKGRLQLVPPLLASKYNAFTERVELPAEQEVLFGWISP
jgi:hypothetical protein